MRSRSEKKRRHCIPSTVEVLLGSGVAGRIRERRWNVLAMKDLCLACASEETEQLASQHLVSLKAHAILLS